ncbi:hypothetical protein N8I77_000004 [Diaporthe amygdali]|uniref:Uncharacterized protein n=1 Tax=Phomopsis amygdali TaxID=1214568 RepID=A0AAD9SNY0_PHOAM|nr:hypothetical protein N8I77_000004 [Diaporthe amygdali]
MAAKPSSSILNSFKLIQWTCFAMESLIFDELRWGMIFNPTYSDKSHSLQLYETTKSFATNCDMMEKKLKALSCGLAEVVQSSRNIKFQLPGSRTETVPCRVVQVIHHTVKDFFIQGGLSTLQRSQDPTRTETSEADLEVTAHSQLSRTCIRYFSSRSYS